MGLGAGLLPWNAIGDLRKKGARATARRLLESRHVADLRLIVSIFLLLLGITVFLLLFDVAGQDFTGTSWSLFVAVTGAVITLFVSLISWVYQTASKRLGVVDLFACEIAAICRVYTVVGLAPRLIDTYRCPHRAVLSVQCKSSNPSSVSHEDSQHYQSIDATKMGLNESYTPVMDNNVGDLQSLDAEVVTNVTAFYTYRRTMLDYLFRWGQETPPRRENTFGQETPPDSSDPSGDSRWHYYLRQSIYMLFLSLESARQALDDLIEYQPNHSESCINVLLAELPAYSFLMSETRNDPLRNKRLALRLPDYAIAFEACYRKTMRSHGDDEKAWARAKTSAPDLKDCYDRAMREINALRSSEAPNTPPDP